MKGRGWEGSGGGTCLPMMPMQAIDGVVMVGTGDEQVYAVWS